MSAKIYYAGLNKNNPKRIWGYLVDDTTKTFLDCEYYVFWGAKDGSLIFKLTRCDREFAKNSKEKVKKYTRLPDLDTRVLEDFGYYRVIKKLKTGY